MACQRHVKAQETAACERLPHSGSSFKNAGFALFGGSVGDPMLPASSHLSSNHLAWKGAAFALVAAVTFSGLPQGGMAQEAKKASVVSLEGLWSGGGSVSFVSGAKEQARCRAHFHRAGNNSYTVNATCATASGRAAQMAKVRQVGANRYSGSFYNSEYSISGVIHIFVRGASQTVRLVSDSGSAVLMLNR
jgi:hypothetical protein